MAHRSSRSSRVVAPRRRKGWALGPGSDAVTAISASASGFLGTAAASASDGQTIIRVRGRFAAFLSAASAVGDGYQGAMGIGVTTTAAILAGIGSVPTPITEIGWDGWMYWQAFGIHSGKTTEADGSASIDFEVDTKAMRKIDFDESLFAG